MAIVKYYPHDRELDALMEKKRIERIESIKNSPSATCPTCHDISAKTHMILKDGHHYHPECFLPEGQRLRDEFPELDDDEYARDRAYKFLDVIVVKVHRSYISPWIGTHKNVHVWVELDNGYAVGWNENPARGWSFPVKKLPLTNQ